MDFEPCNGFTLNAEGGRVNDPLDPGGCTYRGATLAAYRDWIDDQTFTPDQLYALTDAELWAFYHAQYWNPLSGSLLPSGVDMVVYDFGVNAGIRRSGILLQAAIGAGQDGAVGPKTVALVAQVNDRAGLIRRLTLSHNTFYRGLAGFAHDGRGWLNRTASCQVAALKLLAGATPTGVPKS